MQRGSGRQSLEWPRLCSSNAAKSGEREETRGRRQVEEEEEVAVVVMVKGEVGCPGLPAPYSINSASGFVQQRSAHSVRNIS